MARDRLATPAPRGARAAPPPPAVLTRRSFLSVSAAAGGGLLLGFRLPGRAPSAPAPERDAAGAFAPNAFIRIDPDGRITLVMPKVEMGQGTYTSMAMLIAEELEVDLSQVQLEHAPPDDARYAEPFFGVQETGGSTSVRGNWVPLRQAGATARTMLIAAAAATWNVDPGNCKAEHGQVIEWRSSDPNVRLRGRRLGYGELVQQAATLPVPSQVPLKSPREFRLIGTPAKRLDAPDKVTGKAQFGIDVQVPGMKIATLAACPVFGGKLAALDTSKALAIPCGRRSRGSRHSTSAGTRGPTPSSRAPTFYTSSRPQPRAPGWSRARTATPRPP